MPPLPHSLTPGFKAWKVLSKPASVQGHHRIQTITEHSPGLSHSPSNLLQSQEKLLYLNLRRNIPRKIYLRQPTEDLLAMAWKSTVARDLPFSRLKVTRGTNLELWTAICWGWRTKGGDRKRTGGRQVPSDVSLGCVCISWCILRTRLSINMGVSDRKKTGIILSWCFHSTLNYCKIRKWLNHDVKL